MLPRVADPLHHGDIQDRSRCSWCHQPLHPGSAREDWVHVTIDFGTLHVEGRYHTACIEAMDSFWGKTRNQEEEEEEKSA